jgi:hypothetical protein
MVHPFVGISNAVPQFNIHPMEVKELLEVEVNELLSDKNKGSTGRYLKVLGSEMQVPCYDINGKIIWGATAMIISEFTEIIRRIPPLSVSPQRGEE